MFFNVLKLLILFPFGIYCYSRVENIECDFKINLKFPIDYSLVSSLNQLIPDFDIEVSKLIAEQEKLFRVALSNIIVSFEKISTSCSYGGVFCPSKVLYEDTLERLLQDLQAGKAVVLDPFEPGVWQLKIALYPLNVGLSSRLKLCGDLTLITSVENKREDEIVPTIVSFFGKEEGLDDIIQEDELYGITAAHSMARIRPGDHHDDNFEVINFSMFMNVTDIAYHFMLRHPDFFVEGCEIETYSADDRSNLSDDDVYHKIIYCKIEAFEMKLRDIATVYNDVHFINFRIQDSEDGPSSGFTLYFNDKPSISIMRVMAAIYPAVLTGFGCHHLNQACIVSHLIKKMEETTNNDALRKKKQQGKDSECFEQSRILLSGFQHSGTSITRKLIGNHPDVYDIEFETTLFPKQSCSHYESVRFDTVSKDREKKLLHRHFKHVVAKHPIPWDYSHYFVFDLEKMQSLNLKTILLVRNPLDIFSGSKLRDPELLGHENVMLIMISHWKYFVRQLTYLRFYENVLIERYEDLFSPISLNSIENQTSRLEKAFQFLGLSFDENDIIHRDRKVCYHGYDKSGHSCKISASPELPQRIGVVIEENEGKRRIEELDNTDDPPPRSYHDMFRSWQIHQPVHTAEQHDTANGVLRHFEVQTICCLPELGIFYRAAPDLMNRNNEINKDLNEQTNDDLEKKQAVFAHNTFDFEELHDTRCSNIEC